MKDLLVAISEQMAESLLHLLNFFESMVKAVVAHAVGVAVAASIALFWGLAFTHADTFTYPLAVQLRDTALALLQEAERGARARIAAEVQPPS